MNSIKIWIKAFRLRTLPLSLSSILMGSFLALKDQKFSLAIFIFATLTTIFLQILSNLANDYGDTVSGVDNINRVGPERVMQSGAVSSSAMKKGIFIIGTLAFITGILLLIIGLQKLPIYFLIIFLFLGLMAIAAAIKYTIGRKPYGYQGLGDIAVFLFFGLLGVMGTYFLHTHYISWTIALPASSIGLLSASVLNMNNMRDIENDSKTGKNTLVVKIGNHRAKIYHTLLILCALSALACYIFFTRFELDVLLILLPLPIFILNLKKVWTYRSPQTLDPELKKLALATFFMTLLFGIGVIF